MSQSTSELKKALAALARRRAAQLGPAPSDEALVAFAEGRLSGTDADRMREYVSCHPRIARAVAAIAADCRAGEVTLAAEVSVEELSSLTTSPKSSDLCPVPRLDGLMFGELKTRAWTIWVPDGEV